MIRSCAAVLILIALAGQPSERRFLHHLNRVRASRGLRAVEWSDRLRELAERNNRQQHERGLGFWACESNECDRTHEQIIIASDCESDLEALCLWLAEPHDREILLSCGLRRVGFQASGRYRTLISWIETE